MAGLEKLLNNIIVKEIPSGTILLFGGWLFFDTFNKTFWSKLLIIWLGEIIFRVIPRGTHDWSLFIRPDDLKHLLKTTGFEGTEIVGARFDWRKWAKGDFPAEIVSHRNTAIIYFGTARKAFQ